MSAGQVFFYVVSWASSFLLVISLAIIVCDCCSNTIMSYEFLRCLTDPLNLWNIEQRYPYTSPYLRQYRPTMWIFFLSCFFSFVFVLSFELFSFASFTQHIHHVLHDFVQIKCSLILSKYARAPGGHSGGPLSICLYKVYGLSKRTLNEWLSSTSGCPKRVFHLWKVPPLFFSYSSKLDNSGVTDGTSIPDFVSYITLYFKFGKTLTWFATCKKPSTSSFSKLWKQKFSRLLT